MVARSGDGARWTPGSSGRPRGWWRWSGSVRATRSCWFLGWPGAGGCSLRWPARLARRHEVILFGLRGDRASRVAGRGRGVRTMPRIWPRRLIGRLGLERPAVLGVSFGGGRRAGAGHRAPPGRVGRWSLTGPRRDSAPTVGSTIARRVLERLPAAERQRVRQPVLQPAARRASPSRGRWPTSCVERCWETDQGVMRSPARPARVVRRLRPALADRRPDAGPGRLARRDRSRRRGSGRWRGDRPAPVRGRREAGHIGFLTHGREVARQADASSDRPAGRPAEPGDIALDERAGDRRPPGLVLDGRWSAPCAWRRRAMTGRSARGRATCPTSSTSWPSR